MTKQSFSLIPFPAPNRPNISITGKVSLQKNLLALRYSLEGNIEDIVLPSASPNPSRKDELWKSTCFEFFLAINAKPEYWEFNMSPSGDWNVYHMDAYRRIGFREETAISQLPFEIKKESDGCFLDASVDLSSILRPEHDLEMAITAIIHTNDGKESYWALAHPASHPDFHLRESFILALAARTHLAGQSVLGD